MESRNQQFDNELQNVGIESPYQPPKIQRVPEHLRNRENIKEHYSPRLMSIGPIHHGSPNLKLGEKYKLMMAAKYIQSHRLNRAELQQKIADNIDVLKDHFDQDVLNSTEESLDGFRDLDEKLSWMLFIDGCSLLCIFSVGVFDDFKADQLMLLMFLDVILLENQLPYLVLKLLWRNDDWADLLVTIDHFFKIHQLITPKFRKDKKRWWSNCFSVLRKKRNHPLPSVSMPIVLEPVAEIELRPVQRNNEPVSENEPVPEIELRPVQRNNGGNHLQHIVLTLDESMPLPRPEIESLPEIEPEYLVHVLNICRFIILNQSPKANSNEANRNEANRNEANNNEANTNEATNEANSNEANSNEANTNEANTNEANSNEANTNEANSNEANTNEANTNEANTNEANTNEANTNEANNMNQDQESSEENDEENDADVFTYRNVQDLKAAGIKFESSGTRNPRDIKYSKGLLFAKLTLPEIVVNNMTAAVFHNLIAYEMCPDFKNGYEISSFASFMDRIIDYPEDVKELRSKGILINRLGSDDEVANLFNIISTDLVEGEIYDEVNNNIEKHYKSKFRTCIAQGIHGSFSTPWTTLAFLAAFMALALTAIQTWFTVNPAN